LNFNAPARKERENDCVWEAAEGILLVAFYKVMMYPRAFQAPNNFLSLR
jgi:hypothetical protein